MKENLKKMILLIIVFSSIILMLIISCPTAPLFNTTYKVTVYCNHLVDATNTVTVNLWSNANSDYNINYINQNNLWSSSVSKNLTTNSSDVTFTDVMFPVYVFAWWDATKDALSTYNPTEDKFGSDYEKNSYEVETRITISD